MFWARSNLLRTPANSRRFQTSSPRSQDVVARKPVGAFRGTLFGFLLGTVLAGGGLYAYMLDEYKTSNLLLTEDVHRLQDAVLRLDGFVKGLEEDLKLSKNK
ncbi:hypothetical protein K470DRAFT_222627 [Piedraia hortae CBS 480.64]|uniref:Uncharacterized protein n=1 Tax=Piedraia hortae CBS 480.64 TaxID=1314780 RepID=A0A6A7BRV3_9PEZI|nr:hypothetical protein K470DRAFT_222627 [Piedraia hortae CBS 480.64]